MSEYIEEDTGQGKYLTFTLDTEFYGIEVEYVIEIIGIQPITTVPDLPNYVQGIINLRGKIIPVMDVRLKLNKPFKPYNERTCIVVIEVKEVLIGIIVDCVIEVLDISEEEMVDPPDSNKETKGYIKAIGNTSQGVRLLIDCQSLISETE